MALARTLITLLVIALLGALAAIPAAAAPDRSGPDPAAETAAKKKKKAKRTKCRRGYTYSKKRKRCVRKKAPAAPPAQQPGGGPAPGGQAPGGTTDGNSVTSCTNTQGCSLRDDAGFTQVLASSRMAGNEEGSQGFYSYDYRWCGGGSYSYASSYYSATVGNTVEDNRAGSWTLVEGYQVAHPQLNGGRQFWSGAVDVTHSGGTSRVRVDISTQQGRAAVVGPSPFGGNNLAYTAGGAGC